MLGSGDLVYYSYRTGRRPPSLEPFRGDMDRAWTQLIVNRRSLPPSHHLRFLLIVIIDIIHITSSSSPHHHHHARRPAAIYFPRSNVNVLSLSANISVFLISRSPHWPYRNPSYPVVVAVVIHPPSPSPSPTPNSFFPIDPPLLSRLEAILGGNLPEEGGMWQCPGLVHFSLSWPAPPDYNSRSHLFI